MEMQIVSTTNIPLQAKPVNRMNQVIEIDQIRSILYLGVKGGVKALVSRDHSIDTFA